MSRTVELLRACLILLVAAGGVQQAAGQDIRENVSVKMATTVYTPPPPTSISYKFVMSPGTHANRWTSNDVAALFIGTKGSFRHYLFPNSKAPYYHVYYESTNDYPSDDKTSHDPGCGRDSAAPTEHQGGCNLVWVFNATNQNVHDIGPITAVQLECSQCGKTNDFQYGFMYAEYRIKGQDPIRSKFSQTGWLKDWGGVVMEQLIIEDGIDLNAPWRPVDCGSGLGCQVGEYFKVIDLRSSKEPYTTRVNTRHEVTTDEYSRFIAESRSSWEIEASIKTSFAEAKGSKRQDNETTDEKGASREERKSTETDRTETVPPGYLVVYHEVIMAKGQYRPSGIFNLGTRLSDVQSSNTRWLFFANDKFGTPRRFEWRRNTDDQAVFEMIDQRIDDKYMDLLKASGFL